MQKRKLLTLIAGAAMLAALPVQAQGSFPDKLITFVVPFPPGGGGCLEGRRPPAVRETTAPSV